MGHISINEKILQFFYTTRILQMFYLFLQVVNGQFCECDNFSCDYFNGLPCAGPDHGTCECGKCVCKPGWKGSDCSCRDSIDTCIPPRTLQFQLTILMFCYQIFIPSSFRRWRNLLRQRRMCLWRMPMY